MKKNKKWILEGIIYKNKLLLIISIIKSISLGIFNALLIVKTQDILEGIRDPATNIWSIVGNILLFAGIYIFKDILRSTDEIMNLITKNNRDTYFYKKLFLSLAEYQITVFDRADFLTNLSRAKIAIDDKMEMLISSIFNILTLLTSVAGVVVLITSVNIKYLLLFLCISIAQNIYSIIFSKDTINLRFSLDPLSRKDKYYKSILNSREYAKEIRAYQINPWIDSLRKNNYWKIFHIHKKFSIKWSTINMLCGLLLYGLECVLFVLLFKDAYNSLLTIAQIVFVIQSHELFSSSISGIVKTWINCEQCWAYISILDNIIQGATKVHKLPLKNDINIPDSVAYRLDSINYAYENSNNLLFDNLCLEIKRNCTTVILGANGSGKSTLIKLILELIKPNKGTISFQTDDSSATFQDFSRFFLTISENIEISDLDKEDSTDFLQSIIETVQLNNIISKSEFGLNTLLGKEYNDNAVDLSGGEWQQVAFARSIYKNSPIIVLDEPTSALDPIAEERHFSRIVEKFKGRTMIIVTHRIGVTKFADDIILMENGKVAAQGTHKVLFESNNSYRSFYKEQSKWYMDE